MEKIYKGEIQRLLPIFQAMADGRIIQVSENGNDWIDIDGEEEGLYIDTLIDNPQCYRIKPEQKYRPFANAEECWQEMQKHQPFAWIKSIDNKDSEVFIHCIAITKKDGILTGIDEIPFPYCGMFNNYTFADGTPFGIKEEE